MSSLRWSAAMADFSAGHLLPFDIQGGISLACSSVSARAALAGSGEFVVITNPDDVAVYVEFGDATVVATVASRCLLPGTEAVYQIGYMVVPGRRDPVRKTHIA